MSCEKYKSALIEAAVAGAEVSTAVRKHVTACPSCAAEFAQQQSLIAAIDTNLHVQMRAPVPAATLQRLEAHLAQQPQPKRTPRFTQIFAGAFAALAIAAVVFLMIPRHKSQIDDAKQIVSQPKQNHEVDRMGFETARPPSQAEARTSLQSKGPSHSRVRIISVSTATAASHPEPEVLVPPDERIAFDHLIANLNDRERLASAISKPLQKQPEQRVGVITTPEIETASVVVQPLRDSADR